MPVQGGAPVVDDGVAVRTEIDQVGFRLPSRLDNRVLPGAAHRLEVFRVDELRDPGVHLDQSGQVRRRAVLARGRPGGGPVHRTLFLLRALRGFERRVEAHEVNGEGDGRGARERRQAPHQAVEHGEC